MNKTQCTDALWNVFARHACEATTAIPNTDDVILSDAIRQLLLRHVVLSVDLEPFLGEQIDGALRDGLQQQNLLANQQRSVQRMRWKRAKPLEMQAVERLSRRAVWIP